MRVSVESHRQRWAGWDQSAVPCGAGIFFCAYPGLTPGLNYAAPTGLGRLMFRLGARARTLAPTFCLVLGRGSVRRGWVGAVGTDYFGVLVCHIFQECGEGLAADRA